MNYSIKPEEGEPFHIQRIKYKPKFMSKLWKNFKAGMLFGAHVLNQARARSTPVLRSDYSGFGLGLFSLWLIMAGAIAIT